MLRLVLNIPIDYQCTSIKCNGDSFQGHEKFRTVIYTLKQPANIFNIFAIYICAERQMFCSHVPENSKKSLKAI